MAMAQENADVVMLRASERLSKPRRATGRGEEREDILVIF